jgi:hypothetical protein
MDVSTISSDHIRNLGCTYPRMIQSLWLFFLLVLTIQYRLSLQLQTSELPEHYQWKALMLLSGIV